MERQEMAAFVALAEELHFGRAARKLGLSVGRVSQLIKTVERRLGVLLFDRTSRQVSLTPIGAQLYEELLPASNQISLALRRAAIAGRGLSGRLRVGYSSPVSARLLVQTIEAFQIHNPGCEVTIQEILLSDPYGPLRRHEVQLQLTELPMNEPDLVAGPPVLTYPRSMLVPTGHPLANADQVSVEDLADNTLLTIGGEASQTWRDHHFPRNTPTGRPIPHGHAAHSWYEIPVLIAAGKGVSMASDAAEPYHSSPGITWVPVPDAPPIHYAPIWPKQAARAQVRAFIQTLQVTAGNEVANSLA